MSIINNLIQSFAEEIYEPSLCSMTEAVARKMLILEPDGAWTDPDSNSHELIQHLAFVARNPDVYFPNCSYTMIGSLENCIAIGAKNRANS